MQCSFYNEQNNLLLKHACYFFHCFRNICLNSSLLFLVSGRVSVELVSFAVLSLRVRGTRLRLDLYKNSEFNEKHVFPTVTFDVSKLALLKAHTQVLFLPDRFL